MQQFRSVCEELSSALQREQQAQSLLHEQATQLQELGVTMETHTSEQLEKDHTLAQAVQVCVYTHKLTHAYLLRLYRCRHIHSHMC